jgi:hypothetical protein
MKKEAVIDQGRLQYRIQIATWIQDQRSTHNSASATEDFG